MFMLKEETFPLENLSGNLVDIDNARSGSWVAVTGYHDNMDRYRKTLWGTHIHFADKFYELEYELRFPTVRSINEKSALVFGTIRNSKSRDEMNAWIINSSGKVERCFSVNLAVEDILVTKDFIIFTGFDEGPGLNVYDHEGKFLFTYEEVFGINSISIADCYAAAVIEKNQIVFCPYTEFPMVLFDIEAKTQEVVKTPKPFRGFHAITKRGNKIYLHRAYRMELKGYDFGVYEWQMGSEQGKKIGEYPNHYTRGLPGGKFLAKNDSGYAIISVF